MHKFKVGDVVIVSNHEDNIYAKWLILKLNKHIGSYKAQLLYAQAHDERFIQEHLILDNTSNKLSLDTEYMNKLEFNKDLKELLTE